MKISVLNDLVNWTDSKVSDIKISAMPRKKREQLNKIEDQLHTLIEHLCKRLIIIDEQNYNGWERTIRNCADNIDEYRYYDGRKIIPFKELITIVEDKANIVCSVNKIIGKYINKGNILFCYYYKCDNTELVSKVIKTVTSILDEIYTDSNWSNINVTRNKEYTKTLKEFHKKEIETFTIN